jgi:protocatechuate 3,4-dioxygenase beta subunit
VIPLSRLRIPSRIVMALSVLTPAPAIRAAMQTPVTGGQTVTGVITGRVIDAESGAPLPGAIVQLDVKPPQRASVPSQQVLAMGNRPPARVLTDTDGQFAFKTVAAGVVSFGVQAHGYVGGGYNQLRPDGEPQTLETVDGQHISDVQLKVWKTAAITGRVIDDAGEPVVGVFVRVLRRVIVGGQPTLQLSGAGRATDDRGVYRASGLMPGDYVVEVPVSRTTMPLATFDALDHLQQTDDAAAAYARNLISSQALGTISDSGQQVGGLLLSSGRGGSGRMSVPAMVPNGERTSTYPTVFYPSTQISSRATVLALHAGEEKPGIDIQLALLPAFQVTGAITDLDGSAAANLVVHLVALDDQNNADAAPDDVASTVSGARGEFTMLAVPAGEYQLIVVRPLPSAAGRGAAPPPSMPAVHAAWARVPISVANRDVTDVSLALHAALTVGGRVQFDGSTPQPAGPQLARGVRLQPVGAGVRAAGRAAGPGQLVSPLNADGSFAISGVMPGQYMVLPNTWPALKWAARAITANGRDLADVPVDLDADLPDVLITYTDKPGALTGTVRRMSGEADTTALIVGFPIDSRAWGWPGVHQFTTRTTSSGTYTIASVPPGDYHVVAIPDELATTWQGPENIQRLAVLATRVRIGDGVRVAQDLVTVTIK